MGILAYIPAVIGGIAVYKAYFSAKEPTEGGLLEIKKYAASYGLGLLALVLGVVFGFTSLMSGDFISGLIGFVLGAGSFFIVSMIAVFDFGSKAAKDGAEFAKENPQQAAAVASAAVDVADKAVDAKKKRDQRKAQEKAKKERKKENKKERKEKKKQQKKKERKKKFSDFSMQCPGCGQDWIYNSGGMLSGDERTGYQYVGYDDVLGKTEVQCTSCGTTRKLQRSNNI